MVVACAALATTAAVVGVGYAYAIGIGLATARAAEEVVRSGKAVPATIAVLRGIPTIGLSPMELDELANAEGVLRHALQLDPQNPTAHYILGQALMQDGKTEDGKKELAKWQELKNR